MIPGRSATFDPELLSPPPSAQAREAIGQHAYDFYRCLTCRRLVTLPEMMAAVGAGHGRPCPCGGLKFSPQNLPWWGWALPRVWRFAYRRLRKQV